MRVAVIGSTGYIGVRLVPRLLEAGHEVATLIRTPTKLAVTGWADRVDVVHGDLDDPAGLHEALTDLTDDTDVVYYLAHALERPDFPERERRAAERVRDAAVAGGVSRIVFLGGLRPTGPGAASRHLSSRAQVADVFLDSPVPTAALEASIVVGSGSASFEMIRYLAERLPLVPAIPWVANRTQPVAIDDVLHYLVACASLPADVDRRFDLGGPDVLSYLEIMRRYLRLAGLPQNLSVPLPVPVPPGGTALAAYLVGALTPLDRHLVQPLIESLAHDLVCAEQDLGSVVGSPPNGPTTYDAAVRAALGRPRDGGDGSSGPPDTLRDAAGPAPTDPAGSGGPVDRWETTVETDAAPEALWAVVTSLGGDRGWFLPPGVSRARGLVDQLLGGVGAYRGRPHGRPLQAGDVVDGWRVEAVIGGMVGGERGDGGMVWGERSDGQHALVLRSEQRTPGVMRLELEVSPAVTPATADGAVLRLAISFAGAGIAGAIYGRALAASAPATFGTMARGIAAAAGRRR